MIETQPGSVNWSSENNDLDKGEVRAMAWNAVGHGSECVEYWQWRSALNGQEQYHGTLVGPDGTAMPLYTEVQETGAEFEKAGASLEGTTVESEVAILNNFPSRWAINVQRFNAAFNPVTALSEYYAPLKELTRSVDVVSDVAPLSRYKLVVAPALNVLTPEAAQNLESYVRGGGHLVLGQRSGLKDEDNALQVKHQPGPLVDLLGARVEKWYSLEHSIPATGVWGNDTDTIWAELIGVRTPDVTVLMRYGKSNGWLDDQPAAVTRVVGKGRITYIGAALDPATMKNAAKWMVAQSGVATVMPDLPATVGLSIRSGADKRIFILTNYAAEPQTIKLSETMQDVLNGGEVSEVTLPHFGVAVLSQLR